ncbi:TspO/MBR family protein [Nocardioides marmoraquaticus]
MALLDIDRPVETPTGADRIRQVGVTAAEVFCVVGSLIGSGVLGTSVDNTNSGALAADSTLLAPAGPAFSIWSVIYLGLLAYTVWQWLPGRATDPRLRATGWLAALSMVLNAGWLLVTQTGSIWGSVVVIVALLLTLGLLVQRLTDVAPTRGTAERVVVDGTFGLYLGWVSVATFANVAAALTASGFEVSVALASVLLVVVAALAAVYARAFGGRVTVAAAIAWGLAWLAYGRVADAPESTLVAAVAVGAAVVAVGSALTGRTRR